MKKCDPRGGGYSNIFEQHRLSLFFFFFLGGGGGGGVGGFRFESIYFGSGDFLGSCVN